MTSSEWGIYSGSTAKIIRNLSGRAFLAHWGPRDMQPRSHVALKIARSDRDLEDLEKERSFYQRELKPLQGRAVPRLLGFFRGQSDGTKIACMLMEYCQGDAVFFGDEFP